MPSGIDDLGRSDHARAHERIRVHDVRPDPQAHEEELIEEALADLPEFVLEREPQVMFENNGMALGRRLTFDRPPEVDGSS